MNTLKSRFKFEIVLFLAYLGEIGASMKHTNASPGIYGVNP